jgi:AcrR family transcriptional regulator
MEKRLIFDTALRLMREGKYNGASIGEIAHYAKVDEKVILFFFHSKDKLLSALSEYVAESIHALTAKAQKNEISFENRFYNIWFALYHHYAEKQDLIAFIEQLPLSSKSTLTEKKLLEPIRIFFSTSPIPALELIKVDILALVFHSSVLNAAKMRRDPGLVGLEESNQLCRMLWNGMIYRTPAHLQVSA